MRTYSFFTIIVICLILLLIDTAAFYWLRSISQLITPQILKISIYSAFWIFTIGLITSIIILKYRLESIEPKRKHLVVSSLYGLTILSFVPKLIFVIIISILYFTNYLFSQEVSLLIIPLIGVFSGFLPFFIILNGILRTLYRFKVHHIKIKFKNLPKSFIGLKIVHISDLHLGSFNFRYHILDRAIKLINDLDTDFIFFTGDLVNNCAWELKGWDIVLKQLSAKIGKYAILGNHDYGDYREWESSTEKQENFNQIKQFYKTIDFKLLLNEADIIKINEEELSIIGVENWGKPPFKQYGNLKKALTNVKQIPFKILLTHDPSHWDEEVIKHTNIALTHSGHTHGMQAAINLRSKEWSPIKYKYKHWAGLYKENEQYLYVNIGLGWLGFPGRLGMRPEITFIELENG